MKTIVLLIIRFYQKYFSPDHSFWAKRFFPDGYCRFHPTCSMYTHEAIEKHGFFKGGWLGFKRVFRCNPWNPGGHDPVPPKSKAKFPSPK